MLQSIFFKGLHRQKIAYGALYEEVLNEFFGSLIEKAMREPLM